MKKKTQPKWIVCAELHVAKRFVDGRCYAIRFAPNMDADAIARSLARDYPAANEWRAYDESTNTFV